MWGIEEGCGVPNVNADGEFLIDVCAERGMFLVYIYFEHKLIHRHTRRDGEGMGKRH